MTQVYPIKPRALMGLIGIIIVALVLRLGDGASTTHFRYDQATLSQLALDMAHGRSFPLLGIESSAGVPNSPMTVYILFPAFLLSNNPLFVTIYVALLNVVGVALLWFIGQRYFGPLVGFIVGMIYAVNPFAVMYSRSIWAQDYHTPIILLAIIFGLFGFVEKRRFGQLLFFPTFLIGLQIHFAAWTLLPIFLWFLWIGRKDIHWPSVFMSVVLAGLTLVPFLIGILQQPQGATNRAETIINILTHGMRLRQEPVNFIMELATGLSLESSAETGSVVQTAPPVIGVISPLWWGLGLLSLLGVFASLKKRWRLYSSFLLIWAGLTMLVFIPAWTGSGVYRHYFIPSIPALSLLASLGFVGLMDFVRQYDSWQIISIILLGLLSLTLLNQAVHQLDQYRIRLLNYSVNDSGQTATPIYYLLDVREALQPYKDVIILGANPHESNYYVWQPMLYNSASCVRDLLINGGAVDVLPNHPYAVLVAPLNPINADYVVPERYKNDNPQIISLRPGEDPYIIYAFDAAPEWTETPIISIEPRLFETGVQLTGYYLTDEWLQLRWEVKELDDISFQYFGHFLDAQGEKIGQRDAPFYVGQYWCDGDTLITTINIQLPPDTVTLRVGLYSFKDDGGTQSYTVTNPESQEGSLWVDIPLKNR